MTDKINPLLNTDVYKVGHMLLYPKGTQVVYETLTPRTNQYFPWSDKMVVFGYEVFFHELNKDFDENFFKLPKASAVGPAVDTIKEVLGPDVARRVKPMFDALHDKGYLPIKVQSLPEGSLVPIKVPVLTIENTDPDFYWLPGFLETRLLAETFVTSTVASVAHEFLKSGLRAAECSSSEDVANTAINFLSFQFHDFSMRGQHGLGAARLSGMAHLTASHGTDVLSSVKYVRDNFPDEGNLIGGSVLATEHSVMQALGTDQMKAYEYLIDNNPEGILSVVSDTYDYWEVIEKVLPALKDKIMARNGKTVVRPDSLDNVKEGLVRTLNSLWGTFGGTVNDKGYKVLDPHVGLLHGEGVNLDTVDDLFDAIMDAGFSSENIVFGVGAYVYSVLVSRDSFGQALKATSVTISGEEKAVFKDPKTTTESFKKSLRGRVEVKGYSGSYEVQDGFTSKEVSEDQDKLALVTIYEPDAGVRAKTITPFETIRERLMGQALAHFNKKVER